MPHPTSTDRILLPNALLLGEVEKILADGRSVMLRATGNSMLPFIVGGRDSVLVRRPSEMRPLQVGQIALAHLPDSRYVLHRIVHIDGTEIVLMGDGNLRETESCRLSGIVGRRFGAGCSPSAGTCCTYTDGYGKDDKDACQ